MSQSNGLATSVFGTLQTWRDVRPESVMRSTADTGLRLSTANAVRLGECVDDEAWPCAVFRNLARALAAVEAK
jgi:hypothetical protein